MPTTVAELIEQLRQQSPTATTWLVVPAEADGDPVGVDRVYAVGAEVIIAGGSES